ncbi:large subunit ribosomal protein L25 [Propionibacterium cyclohexanicum]|uniref:Large ribosomal subunit protein bL25 n=1 Tax=Propionibacterium cyclohexanicum TaxID=64702 RepID=A0A1H9RHF6_9ACTN|nr:50S ribosomal protein L25/general stress protein Ctc [Propionibacterium cyclohexanicum]SER72124.1 large subunit ribosomal protein L25 [Propionibacterium cyclohexanicum]
MAEIQLDAEARTEFGKGAARRIRRADKIPAVLYGHGTDPVHLTLKGHETLLALRQENALLHLHLADGIEHLALPKQIQRDPITKFIEHVDLLLVKRGEKVTVDVPLEFLGEPAPDSILNEERTHLSIRAEATNIPNLITVSVEGLSVGEQILAAQVTLPEGCELEDDPEQLIASGTAQISEAALEAELNENQPETAGGAEDQEPAAEGAESDSQA